MTAARLGGRGRLREAVARRVAFCLSVLQSGVNYTRNLGWVVSRSLEGRRLRAAVSVACGQLSLAAQFGAIGLLYWYAEQAQADAVVSLAPLGLDLEWRAREDFWLLGAVVAASGLCFLASAGLLHRSESLIITIGEEEMVRRLNEAARIARRLPDPRAPEASRIFLDTGLSRVSLGCRYAALSVTNILGAVTPIVGGVVAGAALVVIDPLLTGILVVGAGLGWLLLYPLMMRQVAIPDRLERSKRAFAKDLRELLRAPPDKPMPPVLGSTVEFARVMIGRQHTVNHITALLQAGTAVCGTIAALYLAAGIIRGDDDWPSFVLYLGGLRIALSSGSALPQVIGTVSRYYARIVEYMQYVLSGTGMEKRPLGRVAAGDPVVLAALPDGTPVDARGGERVALLTPAEPPAVQAAFLDARAAGTGLPLATAWLRPDDPSVYVRGDSSVHLVDAAVLAAMEPSAAGAALDAAPAGVTVIAHRDGEGIGAFDESHVLVLEDGAFTESARLGTAAGRAVLESFAAARAATAAGVTERPAGAAASAAASDQEDEE